jgi:hypothetical protein
MPVEIEDAAARFVGACVVEEAEALLDWLRVTPDATVDLSACEAAHSALLQLLLAAAPGLSGAPPDPVLAAALAAGARKDPMLR